MTERVRDEVENEDREEERTRVKRLGSGTDPHHIEESSPLSIPTRRTGSSTPDDIVCMAGHESESE